MPFQYFGGALEISFPIIEEKSQLVMFATLSQCLGVLAILQRKRDGFVARHKGLHLCQRL
jgi:hypothetical protein